MCGCSRVQSKDAGRSALVENTTVASFVIQAANDDFNVYFICRKQLDDKYLMLSLIVGRSLESSGLITFCSSITLAVPRFGVHLLRRKGHDLSGRDVGDVSHDKQ